MADVRQAERALKILQWLSAGRRMTTKEMRSRFENQVSIRSLQRDMEFIQGAGLPLHVEKGKGNENSWSMHRQILGFIPSLLEHNEILAGMVLKSNLKIFSNTAFQDEIDALSRKLNQLVPDDLYEDVSNLNVFENFTVGEMDYTSQSDMIMQIFEAIKGKHPCQVRYQSLKAKGAKSYEVTPAKMLLYQGALYVSAYIHKYDQFIFLNVHRIQGLVMRAEIDHDVPKFNLHDLQKNNFGVFRPEMIQKVILEFNSTAAPHIVDRWWHSSQNVESLGDGSIRLTMEVGITPELESWLLGWVPYVKVHEPTELIGNIMGRLSEGLDFVNGTEIR